MNIFDIGFILILLFGIFMGFKRGILLELKKTFLFVFAIIFAFFFYKITYVILQYPITIVHSMFDHQLNNDLFNYTVCFLVDLIGFMIIVSIIIRGVDFGLKKTILKMPIKILGAILGFFKSIILIYLIIICVSIFNMNDKIYDSRIAKYLVDNGMVAKYLQENMVIEETKW